MGYQPEHSFLQAQQKRIRIVMDTLWFEIVIIVLVLVYAVVLLIDMTISNDADVDDPECYAITNPAHILLTNQSLAEKCDLRGDTGVLYWLDFGFLIVFLVEILFRLFAFGYRYVLDPINSIDTAVVTVAFIISLLPDEVFQGANFLNLLRIIRLLRLTVMINRLQRSRDAATMLSKVTRLQHLLNAKRPFLICAASRPLAFFAASRFTLSLHPLACFYFLFSQRVMYRRVGAPIERILAFLIELRARQRSQRDQYNIDWMMEAITSDELYRVAEFDEENVIAGSAATSYSTNDMARFLSNQTGLARRRRGSLDDPHPDDAPMLAAPQVAEEMLKLWAGSDVATSGLALMLERLTSPEAWSFEIFQYDVECSLLAESGRSAAILCHYLLERHRVIDALDIDRKKLLTWMTKIDESYLPTNPYHSALHAADVCANVNYFISQPNLHRHLTPLDVLASLVAGIVHDMGHPGVNNDFLEATMNELSVVYNDISVLENHHLAAAFKLLSDKECDWAEVLQPKDYKDFRETLILLVLGTDMRAHFDQLTKLKSKVAGEDFAHAGLERKDTRFLLTLGLHAADIANPAKPTPIATAWARRSMEEFFRQGDREAELGLPVSPFMDRSKVPLAATIINCQVGYIKVMVRPLLSEWAAFLGPEAERDLLDRLEATLQLWETSGAEIIETWGDFAGKRNGVAPNTPLEA